MNRKEFISQNGATCINWTWSWSFVGHKSKIVIFGAWNSNSETNSTLILSDKWGISSRNRRQPGYTQALEHIRLITEENYRLLTFPIFYSDVLIDENGIGPAKIDRFDPVLSEKDLVFNNGNWFAVEAKDPLEVSTPNEFPEGATSVISINSYERSAEARKACIDRHGRRCVICSFSFEELYGEAVKQIIHVHHIKPLSTIKRDYLVNPETDLIPVCPNCHAVIHSSTTPKTIDEVKVMIERQKRNISNKSIPC